MTTDRILRAWDLGWLESVMAAASGSARVGISTARSSQGGGTVEEIERCERVMDVLFNELEDLEDAGDTIREGYQKLKEDTATSYALWGNSIGEAINTCNKRMRQEDAAWDARVEELDGDRQDLDRKMRAWKRRGADLFHKYGQARNLLGRPRLDRHGQEIPFSDDADEGLISYEKDKGDQEEVDARRPMPRGGHWDDLSGQYKKDDTRRGGDEATFGALDWRKGVPEPPAPPRRAATDEEILAEREAEAAGRALRAEAAEATGDAFHEAARNIDTTGGRDVGLDELTRTAEGNLRWQSRGRSTDRRRHHMEAPGQPPLSVFGIGGEFEGRRPDVTKDDAADHLGPYEYTNSFRGLAVRHHRDGNKVLEGSRNGMVSEVCGYLAGVFDSMSPVAIFRALEEYGDVIGLHLRHARDSDTGNYLSEWYEGTGFVQFRTAAGLRNAKANFYKETADGGRYFWIEDLNIEFHVRGLDGVTDGGPHAPRVFTGVDGRVEFFTRNDEGWDMSPWDLRVQSNTYKGMEKGGGGSIGRYPYPGKGRSRSARGGPTQLD